MSAIVQRRVAGATALMILLYLLQVALFSPNALAQVVPIDEQIGVCPEGEPWSSHQLDENGSVSGEWGSVEFTTDGSEASELLTATVEPGYVIEVCVKQGSSYTIFRVNYGNPQPQEVWSGDVSHWGWRLVATPGDITFDIGGCEDEGTRIVSFTVPESHLVAITWTDDADVLHRVGGDGHAFYEGSHAEELLPETYQWFLYYIYEVTSEGVEKIVEVDKGFFAVDPCEAATTTTTTTQATTTTTTQATTTTTAATTTTEATTTTTQATTTTATVEVDDTVLGTTITTVPEVSADTLPFTGSESGDLARLGLLALAAGALVLVAVRRSRDEDESAIEMGGWSTL